VESQQLLFDFNKNPLNYEKGRFKRMAEQVVSATVKRINREKDADKKYRLKIIKSEFHKLADEL
jgi:hypothetical protein